MGTLTIDLLGTSFAIRANEPDDYLNKLLGYYTQIVDEVQSGGGLKEPVQVAIMSGLMLCDELYKEKIKRAQQDGGGAQSDGLTESTEAERITLELIDKIDKALS
ncbi:MAG: cell division protein ZapA [Treponema sp.]|nr:cell division protein ZapA [Treponema sp.]